MANRSSGFTLLEISIVMIVISLVAGVILMGRTLIRNSELQGINGEVQQYINALKNFNDTYKAMPGDHSSFSNYFVLASNNGDGNGIIAKIDEQFFAWRDLGLAKLVEGSYTGFPGSGGNLDKIPGSNVPSSKVSGAGWALFYATNNAAVAFVAGDSVGHVLWLGGRSPPPYTNDTMTPILTSEEADLIDQKMDDGLPGSGRVLAQVNASGVSCHTSLNQYNLSGISSNKICSLVFKTGF